MAKPCWSCTSPTPRRKPLDAALATGMEAGTLETFEQLDERVVTLAASA
jgi:hypothetical protein